ncbi:MAG: transglutaminase-like domain-containing protein [Candidatus Firestonebacteria bacterium]
MKRENLSVAAALLLLIAFPFELFSGQNNTAARWFNVMFKGVKVGYSRSLVLTAEYEGKLCKKTTNFMKIGLKRMGTGFDMDSSSSYYTGEDNTPLYFRYTENQDKQLKITEGKLNGENLDLTVNLAGEILRKSVKYEKGACLADSAEDIIKKRGLKDKDSFTLRVFNNDSLSFDDLKIRVNADKDKKNGYIIEADIRGIATMHQISADNELLKSSVPRLGLEMVRVSEKEALAFIVSELDLMDATALRSNRSIPDFKKVTFMKAEIVFSLGLPAAILEKLPAGVVVVKEKNTLLVTNRKKTAGEEKALNRPIFTKEFQPYLVPTVYEQSNDRGIIEKAVELAGDEPNSYRAAKKITQWVYSHMRKKNYSAGFSSAKEALASGEGDCTEHSVLASALLKASGIPSRIAAGLAPIGDRFYYHMWVEAYTGEWTAMDPTFNEVVLDAAHIKLSDGVLDEQGRYDLLLSVLQYFDRVSVNIIAIEPDK